MATPRPFANHESSIPVRPDARKAICLPALCRIAATKCGWSCSAMGARNLAAIKNGKAGSTCGGRSFNRVEMRRIEMGAEVGIARLFRKRA